MFRYLIILFSFLCLYLLAGCSTGNVSQGIYDGIKVRNDLQSSPAERYGKPETPDYQEYERMRKEQR